VNNQLSSELFVFIAKLKNGVWLLGIVPWLFGFADRIIASFSNGYLSVVEIVQLFIASFFLVGWFSLKPAQAVRTIRIND
jgi:uncharacterized membrane protein